MQFENVCIEGLGYHLPNNRITSADLENRLSPLYAWVYVKPTSMNFSNEMKEQWIEPRNVIGKF